MSYQLATPSRLILDTNLFDFDPEALTAPSLCVQAPGGHGKSALLRELSADGVLIVDDAHLLDDARLKELRGIAESTVASGQSRMVVGYRPWPKPAGLVELLEVLRRRGPQLVLGPFSQAQTLEYLQMVMDTAPAPALARSIHEHTGGVPRFVERLARTMREPGDSVPASAVMQFGPDLEAIPGEVLQVLLAAATGIDLPVDVLGALLSREPHEVDEVVAATKATGLMSQDGKLPPIVRRAVVTLSPASYRDGVWRRLAQLQLQRGASVLPLARSLHSAGFTSGHLAVVFEAAAAEALGEDPALASRLYAVAASSGRPAAARQAYAAALSGDLDFALRQADRILSTPDSPERVDAAMVAATALAHRGQLGRSAELYRWSGTAPSRAFAAIAAAGMGQPEGLDSVTQQGSAADPRTPPTLLGSASALMARGVRETLAGSPAAALSTLVQASALLEPAGQAALLPDSPSALAALVGLHCGEFDIGSSVLDRAIGSRMGSTLMSHRHLLLQAWILMARGQTAAAGERLSMAMVGIGPLEPRDLLFAVALEVGIARRNSDLPGLQRGWAKAREAVVLHAVDLFTLLPLGEFAIAAARLGELGTLSSHLYQARALLERLGNPVLWATPLHWSALHAAIVMDEHAAADEHVAALATARHTRYGAAVAAAGESWLSVLRGNIDPAKVEAAARGLHGIGLAWDGARLAGQAAIRTSDRRAMTLLLDCARMLQGRPSTRSGTSSSGDTAIADPDGGTLSEREKEVAELVVAGLTYKQIGDKLFISAKTVEHHVARIRQRLNCANRGELLARLRSMAADRTNAPAARVPWPRRPSP